MGKKWLFAGIICSLALVWTSAEAQGAGQEVLRASWGAEPEAVGLLDRPEMERCGPLSFTIDKGQLLLLDNINRRVAKAEAGQPLQTLAAGVVGWSICPDDAGGCLVMSREGVTRYGGKGAQIGRYPLQPEAKVIEGYGSELTRSAVRGVALNNVDQKAYPVAAWSASKSLRALNAGEAKPYKGRLGLDDNALAYSIKRISSKDIRVLGIESGGKVLVSVSIQADGDPLGAVLFKGQDSEGRLYVEIERLVSGRAELEVHRYAQDGRRLAVYAMPNDYYTTVYKKTEVTSDGSLYQMLTTPEGVVFYRY